MYYVTILPSVPRWHHAGDNGARSLLSLCRHGGFTQPPQIKGGCSLPMGMMTCRSCDKR